VERVVIEIKSEGDYRATETIADLRNAAETLYFPMRMVGFWDRLADAHLCPQEERQQSCPHRLPAADPEHVDYVLQLQRQRGGSLEVFFPHAEVAIYLG
jgi:hypothetical protein